MQKTSNGAADNGAALDGGGDVDDSGASERRNKRDLDIVRLQLLNAKMQSDRRSADEDRAVAAHLMTKIECTVSPLWLKESAAFDDGAGPF